jgi:hypothetical protein
MNDYGQEGRSPPPARQLATRVGRLREPRHSVQLRAVSHRDALAARRPDGAFYIRLEAIEDLTADLERGFAAAAARA